MTNPVLIPIMVPIGEYQQHMLIRELETLADFGVLEDPLIEGARLRYGATHEETQQILDRLGVHRATAA